jgi:hypothetical protein
MTGNNSGNKAGTREQTPGTVPGNSKYAVPTVVPAVSRWQTRPMGLFGNKRTGKRAHPPHPHRGRGGLEAPRAWSNACLRICRAVFPFPARIGTPPLQAAVRRAGTVALLSTVSFPSPSLRGHSR